MLFPWKQIMLLQFKEIFLFFKICSRIFMIFLKSNWSSDFGHAETGNGATKRVLLRREFFPASGFFVHMRQFHFNSYSFSFFGSDFFSKWFSQSIDSSF